MKYQFPVINHINDVLPHIEGRKEFIVADKGDYIVLNYVVMTPETFSSDDAGWEYRRECRGLTFYKDGTIAKRPFHKFFNVNERDETLLENIDLSEPHTILHKLDGSMITPFLKDGEVQYHTKMGATDVAEPVNEFVAGQVGMHYNDFARDMIAEGKTPIFEWCSRKNRIVIDYEYDGLLLLAIRDNVTGAYTMYDDLESLADQYNIPMVAEYEATFDASFLDHVRGLIGLEGFVVRFDNGHMIKIKAEDYLKLHHAKDAISQEKNVWKLILDAEVVDLKSMLNDEDRVRIEEFESAVWGEVFKVIANLDAFMVDATSNLDERGLEGSDRQKAYAIDYVQPMLPKQLHSVAFRMMVGRDTQELVIEFIMANLSTGTKLDSIRPLFNNIRFDDQGVE